MLLEKEIARASSGIIAAVNGAGLRTFVCYLHRIALEDRILRVDSIGTLKDGRTYSLSSEPVDQGSDDFCVRCQVEEEVIGRVLFHNGDAYVRELERKMRFDGWYIYDVYVEPSYRGQHLASSMIWYGLNIAKSRRGGFGYAITETHYLASRKMFDSMGFSRFKLIGFIKLAGWGRYFSMDLGSST